MNNARDLRGKDGNGNGKEEVELGKWNEQNEEDRKII